jgi:hypothetical protein
MVENMERDITAEFRARLAKGTPVGISTPVTHDIDAFLLRWREEQQRRFEQWHAEWLATHPDDAAAEKPARVRRQRKPTLASIAKQASKAGIEVARYEVEPDKITVVTGKPTDQANNDLDQWMAKRHAH